jgi:hypothetical protein
VKEGGHYSIEDLREDLLFINDRLAFPLHWEKKMETEEQFETTSGKVVTVKISEQGEPYEMTFTTKDGVEVTLTENEILEIAEFLEDYEKVEDDDTDTDDSSDDSPVATGE